MSSWVSRLICLLLIFSSLGRITACSQLQTKQNTQIAKLTANKDRIVTPQEALQEAFKKYWYALIPIIAAGGLAYLFKDGDPMSQAERDALVEADAVNYENIYGSLNGESENVDLNHAPGQTAQSEVFQQPQQAENLETTAQEKEIARQQYDALERELSEMEERDKKIRSGKRSFGLSDQQIKDMHRRSAMNAELAALRPVLASDAKQEFSALGDQLAQLDDEGAPLLEELEELKKEDRDPEKLQQLTSIRTKIKALEGKRDYWRPLLGKWAHSH